MKSVFSYPCRSSLRLWPCMQAFKRLGHWLALLAFALALCCGCQRSRDEVWNDTKTAGRHVQRGMRSLGGKQSVSKQVENEADFSRPDFSNPQYLQDDFIAFEDDPEQFNFSVDEVPPPPPEETPGEEGSSIPGISAFSDPAQDAELAAIFEHVHFEYNSSLVNGSENMYILQRVVEYLTTHPGVYLFVEGHCDKRGPSAYNFALGANRSNAVRNFLVNHGVSADRVFTVSYGKERLLFEEDGEEFHALNRRCQFKTYEG